MLSLPRELLGKSIGNHRLSKLIGMGGTGAVFLGTGADGSEMAVKILIPPVLISEESLQEFHKRFQREAEILSKLNHPYIVPVKGFGTDEASGFPYMLIPYKSGGTLIEPIHAGPLPLERAMKYVRQIAQALSYAHAQNIIHRDIKPANVLLDEEDQASLADFSIAKLFNLSTTTLTSTHQMLGTPAYMAPEQVSNTMISPATDVYGLGVLTYQLFTGRLPFDGSVLLALLQRIMHENPPPPHGLRPDLPAAASTVLFRALAKEPGARFASAEEFAQALEASMQSVLLTSSPYATSTEQSAEQSPEAFTTSTASSDSETIQTALPDVLQSRDLPPDPDADSRAVIVEAQEGQGLDANNDPTIVALYETPAPKGEPEASSAASLTPPPSDSHVDAVLSDPQTPMQDEDYALVPRMISPRVASEENLSSASGAIGDDAKAQADVQSVPLAEDAHSHEEEAVSQSMIEHEEQPSAPPVETTPMATEQQEEAPPTEREGALVSIVKLQRQLEESLFPILSTIIEGTAAPAPAVSLEPQEPQKNILNQPTSLHATIAKTPDRSGFIPTRFHLKRPWPRWQIIAASVLAFLLVGAGIIPFYTAIFASSGNNDQGHATPGPLPPATSATITITPASKTLKKTFTISAVTGLPDVHQHQVLARWIYQNTLSQQRTVNATGKVNVPATTASGTLLFTNSSSAAPLIVPVGTLLTSATDKTVQVVLDEGVNIPAAPVNYTTPNQRPTQRVRAHDAIGGVAGNIAAQKFSIASPACLPSNPICYSAFNDAPFIGGTDAQNYTFVQQTDIDEAARTLQAQMPDPMQVLQGQLSTSEQWIVTPFCKPETSANHAANDKAANVTVSVIFTCTGESYDQKDALETARQELKEQAANDPGTDYSLNGDVKATLQNARLADDGSTVTMTIETEGKWTFALDAAKKQDLAQTLAGKKKQEAQDTLKGLRGIKDVTIQLYDGDQNTFPSDPHRITINTLTSGPSTGPVH